jgi:hypothetical protein
MCEATTNHKQQTTNHKQTALPFFAAYKNIIVINFLLLYSRVLSVLSEVEDAGLTH